MVLDDLTAVVVDLLERHELELGEGLPAERLRPDHIAVLVPSHKEAESVVRALGRAGVPAVRTRTGSVFDTPAATEWRLLLSALERPSHAPTVRAAALGLFLRTEPGALDPLEQSAEQTVADLQRRCADWADRLARGSMLAWYDRVRAECGLVRSALLEAGGERMLTDLDHIAELLAGAMGVGGNSATAVQRALDRLARDSAVQSESEPAMRRIDSDAEAVQVTTLHSSKGLEYPVVLLPFSWNPRDGRKPPIYTEEGASHRSIDVAWSHDWATSTLSFTDRERLDKKERKADEHRLLYVGLTRAKRHTVVWWAPANFTGSSALSRVLFDRHADGSPAHRLFEVGKKGQDLKAFKSHLPDDATVADTLQRLAKNSGDRIDSHLVHPVVEQPRWTPPPPSSEPPVLSVADPEGRDLTDRSWRRWSFSSITATDQYQWAPGAAHVDACAQQCYAAVHPGARRQGFPAGYRGRSASAQWRERL